MKEYKSGGGWQALRYTWRKSREVGALRLYRAMSSKNACKTCALGMGGQAGGMRNEAGHFPEVCKKSLQAMASDMQGALTREFFERYSVAELRSLSPRELESAGRLVNPLILGPGDTHFRPVGWDEAMGHVTTSLKSSEPERTFFYASGRSSNEAGFILNLLARAFGTNHVNNCSYYCHQASGVGLGQSIGSGTATINLDDLDECDLVFLIGGNPASNHPRLMTKLVELRERGGEVVVINPIKETGLVSFRVPSKAFSMLFGSEVASQYLQPRIGTDTMALAGITKAVFEAGAEESGFIGSFTEGFAEFKSCVLALTWDEIENTCGLSQDDIRRVARSYCQSERSVFAWTMGITHHVHGVENVRWIANLALLRGMVGKPGAGLLPIRGHSNVQGMGTVGVTPAIGQAVVSGLEAYGVPVPGHVGHDTLGAIEAAAVDKMDFALCLGGNLFGASPDSEYCSRALAKLNCLTYLSTTLNTGHVSAHGKTTVILPVRARDEEDQSTTQESMFSFVRLSDGGEPRHDGPRTEVDVLTELAGSAVGNRGPLDWDKLKDHDEIRRLIASVVPNLKDIEKIGETREEFQIPGRIFHAPKFQTPSGKARFSDELPLFDGELGQRELTVMTIRSEGQFNTVVYEEEDIYRRQDRRDIIMMSPADVQRMGFQPDQVVTVTGPTGRAMKVVVRVLDIAQGCAAMYCPEANILVPRVRDIQSKTPAFKAVRVTVAPKEPESR